MFKLWTYYIFFSLCQSYMVGCQWQEEWTLEKKKKSKLKLCNKCPVGAQVMSERRRLTEPSAPAEVQRCVDGGGVQLRPRPGGRGRCPIWHALIGQWCCHFGIEPQVIGQQSFSNVPLNFRASIWDSGPTLRQLSCGALVQLRPVSRADQPEEVPGPELQLSPVEVC